MYLKVLMEKIVLNDANSISTMTAIHLSNEATQQQASQSTSSTKKITKQRAEELLDEWVLSGYLLLISENALLTLGPKAIAEFRDTLRTKFPNHIQNCHLCNEIVLKVCLHRFGHLFTLYGEFHFHFVVVVRFFAADDLPE